jgi:thiopeptide-type bacteriocin biosynthesis protein
VVLAEGDNELITDLDNVLSIETMLRRVTMHRAATFVELFPSPGELCARGPEGRFLHELVVPLVSPSESPRAHRVAGRESVARVFPPGSEWLYVKLYAGAANVDRVLVNLKRSLFTGVIANSLADMWFFVRYADPEWHLRLRLHGEPNGLWEELFPRLSAIGQDFLGAGLIWRLQLDTYEPECVRYGGKEAPTLSEELFCHDSEAATAIIATVAGDERLGDRWRLAVVGVDRLLDDLGFALDEKCEWSAKQRDAFAVGFRIDGDLKQDLSARYRKERPLLEELLGPMPSGLDGGQPGVEVFCRRSEQLRPLGQRLRVLESSGMLTNSIRELAGSYAHMHANRMLRSAHRAQEFVIYDFLLRWYRSRLARQ